MIATSNAANTHDEPETDPPPMGNQPDTYVSAVMATAKTTATTTTTTNASIGAAGCVAVATVEFYSNDNIDATMETAKAVNTYDVPEADPPDREPTRLRRFRGYGNRKNNSNSNNS